MTPKSKINRNTSTSYTVLVEAPSEDAALTFYDNCDSSEFLPCNDDTDRNLDDLFRDDSNQEPDVRVGAQGVALPPGTVLPDNGE